MSTAAILLTAIVSVVLYNVNTTNALVTVSGDIRLSGGDCAEEFDLSTTDVIDAGTVMVLDHSGNVEQSNPAYDNHVDSSH